MVLLAIAVWMTLDPPDRTEALTGCPSAADGCLVSVDGDTTTIAAALVALAAGAALIALLGLRFTSLKAAGVELSFEAETEGLAPIAAAKPPALAAAEPPPSGPSYGLGTSERTIAPAGGPGRGGSPSRDRGAVFETSPVDVDVRTGLGTELGVVPVAVASLSSPMNPGQASFLRDYQGARRVSQNGWFATHILGPAKSPGQTFSVAIKVTPHSDKATGEVVAARFYLGRAWGHQVFDGTSGPDGRFGITTEAYGAFLALCEVEFAGGQRILLDHYCDFDMGSIVRSSAPT